MPTYTKPCPTCKQPFEYVAKFQGGTVQKYCKPSCRPSARAKAAASAGRVSSATAVGANPHARRCKNAAAKRMASGRRWGVDPTTCEVEYSDEQLEFLKAMETYKRESKRPFPTLRETLDVLRSLGYRRVAEPGPLPGTKGA